MNDLHANFCENLKHACATRRSISELCRDIGMNRQQFNRYINGGSRPSPNNRLRIAATFDLAADDFDLSASAFRRKLEAKRQPPVIKGPLADAFPGNLPTLQSYLGFYQTWHMSLSWPGWVVCSCAHLRIRNNQVQVTSLERIVDSESGIRQRSRYVGLAGFQRQRIFITELTSGPMPTFGQTVLMPFEVHQRQYLRGLTMGLSWRHDNRPYATRTIWRYRGLDTDKRALIQNCGVYRSGSAELPSVVVSFLANAHPLDATTDLDTMV